MPGLQLDFFLKNLHIFHESPRPPRGSINGHGRSAELRLSAELLAPLLRRPARHQPTAPGGTG